MLTIACVEVGDYLARGAEYVAKLSASVARHMHEPYVFKVLTDNVLRHWPTLQRNGLEIVEVPRNYRGWWSKMHLFRPEVFNQGDRILYFDLDTVIVGDLDPLTRANGILHLGNWGWPKNDYGSGVMAWRHGEHSEVWSKFDPSVMDRFRGDQDWLTHLGGWPALPDGVCVSYRYHCRQGIPAGASVVCFHGQPRPHEARDGWMKEHWRAD